MCLKRTCTLTPFWDGFERSIAGILPDVSALPASLRPEVNLTPLSRFCWSRLRFESKHIHRPNFAITLDADSDKFCLCCFARL